MTTIHIATDGSCIQQGDYRVGDDTPRPAAYGFVVAGRHQETAVRTVAASNGTIGAMEVNGLLSALAYIRDIKHILPRSTAVEISCDSQYVVNGYNEWLSGWAAKNFTKKGGLKNAEEWRAIDALKRKLADLPITVRWVRGHSGHPLNERADAEINSTARTQSPRDTLTALEAALSDIQPAPAVDEAPETVEAPTAPHILPDSRTEGMTINAPTFFADPAFVDWLNSPTAKFTLHRGGHPHEYSDTIVMVDSSLSGEGSDSDMPAHIWNQIIDICREHLGPRQFSYHYMVRLTNLP